MWFESLGDEFIIRPRLSRIYYKRRFFDYPLRLSNVIYNLGLVESFLIFLSYARARVAKGGSEDTFEGYIVNRFGRRLYEAFFRSYTEKVWGIPCSEIRSEWAAQRIKDLSFTAVLRTFILGNRNRIKSLIEEFHYPKEGPGQLWNAVKTTVEKHGGKVRLGTEVVGVVTKGDIVVGIKARDRDKTETAACDFLINSMPLRDLIQRMEPKPPKDVLDAAQGLKYRDFITVALVIGRGRLWPDNWIYIHDKEFRVGRVQNFKNWSPYMVPDDTKTCIGMEFFAFENDDLWEMCDDDLITLSKKELVNLSLIDDEGLVEKGMVVRVKKTYPTYDMDYQRNLSIVRDYLAGFKNLYTIGRNGMHRYNNMDHSMLTAMLAVENIYGASHDIWSVNAEKDYHEVENKEVAAVE
jgi:protoporphyrinogen oxidase